MRGVRGVVKVAGGVLESLRRHARDAYPEECCGALLGRVADAGGQERTVLAALPVENAERRARERRYLVPAAAVLAAEADARSRGLDVVGFYHSHPDAPAEPSAYDVEHAWPWYAYLIVGVRGGEPAGVSAWRLAEDRRRFQEVRIIEEREP